MDIFETCKAPAVVVNEDVLAVAADDDEDVVVVLHGHCKVGKFEHRNVAVLLQFFVFCCLALLPFPELLLLVAVMVNEAGRFVVLTHTVADDDDVLVFDEDCGVAVLVLALPVFVVTSIVCGAILLLLFVAAAADKSLDCFNCCCCCCCCSSFMLVNEEGLYGEPGSEASSLEAVLESVQLKDVATPLERYKKN